MMAVNERFDRLVRDVVANGLCSGCGLCTKLDAGLGMKMSSDGYLRPVRTEAGNATEADIRVFNQACPGRQVVRPNHDAASCDPILGNSMGIWQAWSTDEQQRFVGSSGGVLTALATFWLDTNPGTRVAGAASDPVDARRSVSVVVDRREDVLRLAGSRYAPTSNASLDDVDFFVGKPCEVSATRQSSNLDEDPPLLLSFFCAGTPSQHATDSALRILGFPESSRVDHLRYRGHGWPGEFQASADGRVASLDYQRSWGEILGPAVQWRCKICPDGLGNSADVVAGDFWETDERGYPVFAEGGGKSALIARTERGSRFVQEALAAGVIQARAIDPDAVSRVQPLQVERVQTLAGRLIGAQAAGRRVPRYRGFSSVRLGIRTPIRSLRYAWGSFRRARDGRYLM